MNGSRTQAVILSFAYLFLPMLFSGTQPENYSIPQTNYDVELLGDMISGKGGPENIDVFLNNYFSDEEQLEDDVKVTITKKFNYYKIANTVMPTENTEVSSDYGWRSAPCKGCSSNHQGIDFVPGYGEPVFAVTDGMVIDMGVNGGYGNFIMLKHLVGNSEGGIDEWITLYAHLKTDSFVEGLKIGSVVKTGEQLAAVGSTGMSTGPHLHFELRINGENVDPLPLLGTYEVVVVSEEEKDDYLFIGEKFKVIEKIVSYE